LHIHQEKVLVFGVGQHLSIDEIHRVRYKASAHFSQTIAKIQLFFI